MDLGQLRVFDAVAHELHFGRAAAYLNMSQQAVSMMVRRLEDEVGAILFERSTRKVALTPAGEVFRLHAASGLTQIERGRDAVRRLQRGQGECIVIGYSGLSLFRLFPDILNRFCELNPRIEVGFRQEAPPKIFRSLRAGDIDAAFTHPFGDLQRLLVQVVRPDRMMAILPRGHRLETAAAVSAEDIRGENLIGYLRERHEADEEPVGALFRETRDAFKVGHLAESSTCVIELVAMGLGVSIALESTAAQYHDRVIYKPLAVAEETRADQVFVTRRDERSTAVLRLREVVAQHIARQK